MSNNWKKAVEKLNREKYRVPDGWDTKESVALQLGCTVDRVNEIIKPGLQSGDFERQDFLLWDERRGTTARTSCYRIVDRSSKPEIPTKIPTKCRDSGAFHADSREARIAAAILKHPDWTDLRVAKSFKGATAGEVRGIRESM